MADYKNECPFPVGSIFITTTQELPSSIRQNTYRVPFGKGRTLVCVDDASQTAALKTPEQQLGSAALATTSISTGDKWSATVVTWTVNYQPSITVYMWKRVQNKSEVTKYNWFNIEETEQSIKKIYWDNVIIDYNTLKPKQPDPYNP